LIWDLIPYPYSYLHLKTCSSSYYWTDLYFQIVVGFPSLISFPYASKGERETIQSPAPGQPATFGGSKMFCPRVANSFGIDGQVSGSLPVDLIVPIMKSIGDLTIVARF
jgi:hypothetical protein